MMTEYNVSNPLRCFYAFAGYNSQKMALQRLADVYPDFHHVCVGWSEIDENAIKANNAVFPEDKDKNFGDITKIDWAKVPDFDLFTMSSPCFVKGTLVLTDEGYKEIQDIKIGNKVLTHNNKYQVVEKVGNKLSDDIYRIKSMVSPETICSGNHPFYARRFRRINRKIDGKTKSIRQFSNPEWIEARYLDKNCYLGYAINTESRLPLWNGVINNMWGHDKRENAISAMLEKPQFWYLMGRYVGDGWKKPSKTGNSIVICCVGRYEDNLINAISELGFNYTKVNERTVRKYIISRNELYKFVDRYGYYAYGKHIDGSTLDLPAELLKHFLDGILESDGCYTQNTYKVTSVSKELIYGIAAIVAKVHKVHPRIYYFERNPKYVIEGREVNQRSTWTVCWHTDKRKQDHAFYEDGTIWFPIKEIEKLNIRETVFNIQVADDHSYTANGAIVHNCQDFSMSGKRRGGEEGSGTRSSLLWECTKAIEIKRPRYILFENVKGLISGTFLKGFHKWQSRLHKLGYENFTQVLNASSYNVPQNRERVFMISILRTDSEPNPSFYFPKKMKLERRIKDILEPNVDESFYLSDKALEYFCRVNNDKSHGHNFTPKDGEDVAFTVRCASGQRVDDNFLKYEE